MYTHNIFFHGEMRNILDACTLLKWSYDIVSKAYRFQHQEKDNIQCDMFISEGPYRLHIHPRSLMRTFAISLMRTLLSL